MYPPSLHSRSTCQPRHTLAPLATAILISLLGVLPPSSLVWAQGSAQNSGRAIDIPAGPLGPALARYAQHMQVLLSFPPSQTDGLQTPGLQGIHSLDVGFAQLLSQTPLQIQRQTDGSYTLTDTPEYKTYIGTSSREKPDEKKIIEFILNDLLLANEVFVSHIEENFSNWDDDGEMVVQLLTGYIQKPGGINFNQMMSLDKEQFAYNLLQTVLEKSEHLQALIIPKLKNWDPERIAQLDMIMMKMGVAEFLFFETIPPKVTINEYIDLAKDYSTQQSGQFVNGILDNIHKELVQQGKMQKVDYKKP